MPARGFVASEDLEATNDCASTGFNVRLALAAACSSENWMASPCTKAQLCFVHDATECPWELYRWLSNGMRLYYGLLRREP